MSAPPSAPLDLTIGHVDGVRVLFATVAIPAPGAAPDHVREGLRRRRLATIEGLCPCGGRRPILPRRERRLRHLDRAARILGAAVEHAAECLAIDPDVELYVLAAHRLAR